MKRTCIETGVCNIPYIHTPKCSRLSAHPSLNTKSVVCLKCSNHKVIIGPVIVLLIYVIFKTHGVLFYTCVQNRPIF